VGIFGVLCNVRECKGMIGDLMVVDEKSGSWMFGKTEVQGHTS